MINSFFVGITRATLNWKMILMLLSANIICALPIALPIFLLVARTTNGTLTADKMFADKLDFNWIADIINHRIPGAGLETTAIQVGLLIVLMGGSYLLINILFAGGILEVLTSEDGRFTMHKFWVGCGTYFWRFFRLMTISLIFYGAACFIFFLARWPIERAAVEASGYESLVYSRWGIWLLLMLLFTFVNLVFDYARIGTVIYDRRRMFRETIRAAKFAWRHFWRAYSLYVLIAIVGTILFLIFTLLRASVEQSSSLAVFTAIVLGQIAIASRVWTRLTFYAAELDLYRRLRPIILPEQFVQSEPQNVILPEAATATTTATTARPTESLEQDPGNEGAIL